MLEREAVARRFPIHLHSLPCPSVGAKDRLAARPAGIVLLSCLLALASGSASASQSVIPFKSGPVSTSLQSGQALKSALQATAASLGARHVVVQLAKPATEKEKLALRDSGLELLSPLGGSAYFARTLPGGLNLDQLGTSGSELAILDIDPAWKAHPTVTARDVPSYAIVDDTDPSDPVVAAYLLFHSDVDLEPEGEQAAKSGGATPVEQIRAINGLVVTFPLSQVDSLVAQDEVMWLEWPLPPMSEVNDSNRAITQADTLQAAPYGLDGTGVSVMVYDGGYARASHNDFGGRLTVYDSSGLSYHATHVAGTIGGDGSSSGGTYKGMAPATTLLSYGFQYNGTGTFLYSNPGDINSDYDQAINTHGADISNNSIGTNTEPNGFPCSIQGDYGVTSALIDSIAGGSLGAPFRIVWANGNERQGSRCDVEGFGDYYSTAPPAGAKNHITVGALNSNNDSMTSFSSWGPVDDGRMKPDISAPGCQSNGDGGVTSTDSSSDTAYLTICGTSMAAPTVTGLAALMLEDFRTNNPGEPDPRNSTLKTLFAHNAVDLGNVGPDHVYGYGSVRAQATVDFMRDGNFLEEEVDQGTTFTVSIPVSASDTELKVTVAWDDAPGTPNVDPALVNDLDVRVISPSSTTHLPWTLDPAAPSSAAVQNAANRRDNIEQVYVSGPEPGVWRVEVVGFSVPEGPQSFSLAASPTLTNCTSAGTLHLSSQEYTCSDSVTIHLNDCDLNTDDATIQTASVSIASGSEPGGESVLLTETGAATAAFSGSISLATANSVGVLQVADGETITATYIDADDGQGGNNVPVTASAGMDCVPPNISNVQTLNISLNTATASFDTDEGANGTVSFGSSCGSLTESAVDSGYPTSHSINLTGLTNGTTYYYSVAAEDQASNSSSDDNGGACFSFSTVDAIDYFTESFGGDNDLDNTRLTFTPDGSADFYCGTADSILALPVDPSGGTVLSLGDDDFQAVTLPSNQVSLYGTAYSTFYVGSNGYITFTSGDTDYTESLSDHFDLPRISPLFDDMNPSSAGSVSWQSLADRIVVTWQGVPEYGTSTSNTMQVEMHFDGTIVLSYLAVAATDGIAGLSAGGGQPSDFVEIDLTTLDGCTCDDDDGDGACNDADNCLEVANPSQVDTDQDGYGNLCDPDLNEDGTTGIPDFNEFRAAFGASCSDVNYDADADFNSDCAIGIPDFNIFRDYFGGPPGPSGYACAGTIPCPSPLEEFKAGGSSGPTSGAAPSSLPTLGPAPIGLLAVILGTLGLGSLGANRRSRKSSRARRTQRTKRN